MIIANDCFLENIKYLPNFLDVLTEVKDFNDQMKSNFKEYHSISTRSNCGLDPSKTEVGLYKV